MNNKQLKAIKNHVTKFGGATLEARGLAITALKRGYMVSIEGYELQTTLDALNKRTLEKYQRLAKAKNGFLGLWIDNGVLYVDISKQVMQLSSALSMAKSNNQLAIYCNAKGDSIYLK